MPTRVNDDGTMSRANHAGTRAVRRQGDWPVDAGSVDPRSVMNAGPSANARTAMADKFNMERL
jgi:hypothetical protein